MKNSELNLSIECKKIMKSRNPRKMEELETRINKITTSNLQNKELFANKTFFHVSNDFEQFASDQKIKANKNVIHKKTFSNNIMKSLKFSPPKKPNLKENNVFNKSHINTDFLKNAKFALKNNKSINHFIKKVEARSNNISPINTSFNNKHIIVKKKEKKSKDHLKDILETENDFTKYPKSNTIQNEQESLIFHSKFNIPTKKPTNIQRNDEELSETSRNKINNLKDTVYELLEKQKNKKIIVKELQNIYNIILEKVDPSSEIKEDESLKVIDSLKLENFNMKMHIKSIDKKFDYIIKENKELKDYIKFKTDEYENNLHKIVYRLQEEFRSYVDNNMNNYHNTLKKQTKSTPSQGNKNTEKTSTHYKESPISNNDYSDNLMHTEGTESNKNKLILNGEDSKEYDILDSAKVFASPKIPNDNINQDEEKITFEDKNLDKKVYESINNVNNNLGFTLSFNNHSFKEINTSLINSDYQKNIKCFDLNLENLPKKDFNDEFMEKYEEFSPSWRNECHKMKGVNLKKR